MRLKGHEVGCLSEKVVLVVIHCHHEVVSLCPGVVKVLRHNPVLHLEHDNHHDNDSDK